MPDANGHAVSKASLLARFERLPWPTQIFLVIAAAITGVGVPTAGVGKLLNPSEAAIAQLQVQAVATQTAVDATNQKLDALTGSITTLTDLMTYYVCENDREKQWMVSLGTSGQTYCQRVQTRVINTIIRDAWTTSR